MKADRSKSNEKGELKNGISKEFFKDGSISIVGEYRDGGKTGEWKYYLKNGRLKAIGCFVNNRMTGA